MKHTSGDRAQTKPDHGRNVDRESHSRADLVFSDI